MNKLKAAVEKQIHRGEDEKTAAVPTVSGQVGAQIRGMWDEMENAALGISSQREFLSQLVVAMYLSWQKQGKPQFSVSQVALLSDDVSGMQTEIAQLRRQVAALSARVEKQGDKE